MKRQKFIFLILIISLLSCSTGQEVVMPFRNMVCSGERLFPIEKNDSEKAFRAWINNGTSIDRVVSVSSDSIFGNQATLTEFGYVDKNGLFKHKGEKIFKDKSIIPESGFERFFEIIDSLNLVNYSSQDSFDYILNHQPFSLYVIEIKLNHKYNQFQFRTHFPDTTMRVKEKYEFLVRLLFNEFNYDFYMKKNRR